MRVRVKICGITDPAGLEAAVDSGADAVGFVLAESKRRVEPLRAAALARELPIAVLSVAVFHHPTLNELRMAGGAFRPDLIQAEPSPDVLREIPSGLLLPVFHDSDSLEARMGSYWGLPTAAKTVLLEGSGRGGRGVRCDWSRAARVARLGGVILAGGLTPETVGEAIRRVRPEGVDVSSGVESSQGMKDPARVRAFVQAVRDAEQSLRNEVEARPRNSLKTPGASRPSVHHFQGIANG